MLVRLGAVLVVSLAATAADAGPASRSEPDRSALKQRCSGDYATCCGELPPDGAEVQACFRDNWPACHLPAEPRSSAMRKAAGTAEKCCIGRVSAGGAQPRIERMSALMH
ncbi:Hypothetical protein MexAM1_META1p4073 [Methylorubrum extorquens AM1]|uniref:Uncharacterized protein n=1 Tax=Methylorubrum extorquens (strain ATCC 14718 / DSM 1338 / JCM 2805 / NCIMB 9133 / AM1) TaxID=272630 RepID=C5B1C8_METEA|nr:Hypothetical protein MexAM1_META1p4073 [Methylorubrum extorquens AM1]